MVTDLQMNQQQLENLYFFVCVVTGAICLNRSVMMSCAEVIMSLTAIDENPLSDEIVMILLAEEEEKALTRPCFTYHSYN